MKLWQLTTFVTLSIVLQQGDAHQAAWARGMYCRNGTAAKDNQNTNDITVPMFDLDQADWWMHHVNKCDEFPPPAGEFLELPVGKNFTVEIATNRAFTTFSYGGSYATDWPNGKPYPGDNYNPGGCITDPNLHSQNRSMAAGTAFAISYTSDIKKVTPENLVVFSVRYHTPWKRLTSYTVPVDLPSCPTGGCICAWGWVPNGCGKPNMYMTPFKCTVTGSKSTKKLAVAKPPLWCEGNPSACQKGAKQMIFWHQNTGNNIDTSGYDLHGQPRSPAYNANCGFADGAQNDIYETAATVPTSTKTSTTTAKGSTTTTKGSSTSTRATVPRGEGASHFARAQHRRGLNRFQF